MIDYQKVFTQKVSSIKPSIVREFFDIVAGMKDAISLCMGEPDFETPILARNAGISAIQQGKTAYTANRGLIELRNEISNYMHIRTGITYDPQTEILVTSGVVEGIDTSMRAYLMPGDEILIPAPSFTSYQPLAILTGAIPVIIETLEKDDFRLTPEQLKSAITPKTKMLILPFPNNPTGAIMTKADLEAIAKVIEGTNILVLSDEVYSELTYGGKHISFCSIDGMRERTIVLNGFSKAYAMTGWRLGYACGPKELITPLVKVHSFSVVASSTISQYAGIEAMRSCDADIIKMRDEYDTRRKFVVSSLRNMGLSCFEPKGAFYVFPSIKSTGLTSREFCLRFLNEQKVAVVPGNAFGESGEGFIRISYSYSMEHLKESMRRMGIFISSLK